MKESYGQSRKNTLNEERIWDEFLYFELKLYKFWALILLTGDSIKK